MGNKDFYYANIKPKGDGALNILDDALLLHTCKQSIEISIRLTHKEHDLVVHRENQFTWEGNSFIWVWTINGQV